jgi:hypothetical protein
MIVALVALVLALAGTGYAAVTLPKNSVGANQLRKSAVTSAKVKDGSLLSRDFKAGQIPAGAPGPKGDKGDKGDPGQSGSLPITDPGALIAAGVVGNNDLKAQLNRAGAAMTLQHTEAGKYEFSVPGVAVNGFKFAVSVTPMGNGNIPVFADVTGFNGDLIIELRDAAKAPADSDFSFEITRVGQ